MADVYGLYAEADTVHSAVPAGNQVVSAYGRAWERLYEAAAYQGKDDDPVERAPTGWTRTFPHVVGSKSGKPDGEFFGHWMGSPFSDEYLGKLAAASVDAAASR